MITQRELRTHINRVFAFAYTLYLQMLSNNYKPNGNNPRPLDNLNLQQLVHLRESVRDNNIEGIIQQFYDCRDMICLELLNSCEIVPWRSNLYVTISQIRDLFTMCNVENHSDSFERFIYNNYKRITRPSEQIMPIVKKVMYGALRYPQVEKTQQQQTVMKSVMKYIKQGMKPDLIIKLLQMMGITDATTLVNYADANYKLEKIQNQLTSLKRGQIPSQIAPKLGDRIKILNQQKRSLRQIIGRIQE
jgi:hypothetical protein